MIDARNQEIKGLKFEGQIFRGKGNLKSAEVKVQGSIVYEKFEHKQLLCHHSVQYSLYVTAVIEKHLN